MKFEKQLLKDILWNFDMSKFETKEDFEKDLRAYNKTILGKDIELKNPILACSEVQVQYEYWGIDEDGDEDTLEPVFLLKADNGENFSAAELLYKIHNEVCEKLQDEDKKFFEGLELWEQEDSETPYYLLQQGS